MTVRRKLAISTWSAPREGNIYGKLTIHAEALLRYVQQVRDETGEKVTITHVVGAAVGRAMAAAPGLNGRILLGRFIPHKTVDVAYLVALDGGSNLGKVKIDHMDTKTPSDVAVHLRELASKLRDGTDEAFKKSMGPIKLLPTWIIRPLLYITGWLASSLGASVPALGVERYPFGSCIITSVGMFGLDEGWAPPTPFARVPVYVLVGAIKDDAVVRDGKIVPGQTLSLCATIDHRFLDGFQGGMLARTVRELLEDPWKMDPNRERPKDEAPWPEESEERDG